MFGQMVSLEPFRLDVPVAQLTDLHERLDRTRWPDQLPGVGWAYGIPLDHVRELVRYWRHEYDWPAAQGRLNAWPQFTTEIDGARLHFAHIRSPEPAATPLLMTHGWPGSIVEFSRIAGLLAGGFHLVLPHIPGFALSGPTREPGWEHRRVAAAFAELMERLGYERYGVQGGDWGAQISRELGRVHPERIIGVHLNLLPRAQATTEPTAAELAALDPAERERTLASWRGYQEWVRERQGYGELQATRPQTLAYALVDSPAGQLAWIAEKFAEWSDESVDRDLLLTNVMLYWLTGTAGSSARIYYERDHAPHGLAPPEPSRAPTAVAVFPRENFIPLRHIAEQTNRIVRWTEFDRGGHFAALEQPELLAADIQAFFRELRA